MDLVRLHEGDGPLILSMPHVGTWLPDDVAGLNEAGRAVADTDWHVDRLYDFGPALGATTLAAVASRYVVDVNRDPSGASLYPGQATTGLCPTTTFDGAPIHAPGAAPDAAEIERRRQLYFVPYHAALARQLDRLRARHGFVLLWDCHSIRSVVPRLFEGRLPVFNVGTNGGRSCASEVEAAVVAVCREAAAQAAPENGYDWVLNGRFTGGWITRNYGRGARVHAVQLELAQRAYMAETPPWTYDEAKAARLKPWLRRMVEAALRAAQDIEETG